MLKPVWLELCCGSPHGAMCLSDVRHLWLVVFSFVGVTSFLSFPKENLCLLAITPQSFPRRHLRTTLNLRSVSVELPMLVFCHSCFHLASCCQGWLCCSVYQISIPFHCSASLHSMGMPSFIQLFLTSWTLLDHFSYFSVMSKAPCTCTHLFLCGRHILSSLGPIPRGRVLC